MPNSQTLPPSLIITTSIYYSPTLSSNIWQHLHFYVITNKSSLSLELIKIIGLLSLPFSLIFSCFQFEHSQFIIFSFLIMKKIEKFLKTDNIFRKKFEKFISFYKLKLFSVLKLRTFSIYNILNFNHEKN